MDGLGLRPVAPADDELLFRIYASTRAEELAAVPWDAAAKETFLRGQFAAQSAAYERYAGRSHQIVVLDGEPVGRLYLARGDGEIAIVDIALLPAHRGRGIGTTLLRDVLDEAAATGSAVTIHALSTNPALRLYRRLGFTPVGDDGVYVRLQVKTAS